MKRGLSLGWSLWLACLICGFSRGAVLLHEDWNSGHIDTSRWEYAGMPINSSLVDLGGGDWALKLDDMLGNYNTGLRSRAAFARGNNLHCTFRLWRKNQPLDWNGICGPFVNRNYLSRRQAQPSLAQIEAGLTRYVPIPGNAGLCWGEGVESFLNAGPRVEPAFFKAWTAATNKSAALWVRVWLGNTSGAKCEWSTDGANWKMLQLADGTPINTIGQPAGSDGKGLYRGESAACKVGSKSPVWIFFGGGGNSVTYIDDIEVVNDAVSWSPAPAPPRPPRPSDAITGEMLRPRGEYYTATVPDTLDLAERARLAVHGLTASLDPAMNYAPFGHACFLNSTPCLLDRPGGPPNWGKITESMVKARIMCGSEEGMEAELQSFKGMVDYLTPAGINPVAPTPHSRAMIALNGLYGFRPSPGLRELIVSLGQAHLATVRQAGAASYFNDAPPDNRECKGGLVVYADPAHENGSAARALALWGTTDGDSQYLTLAGRLGRGLLQPRYWTPEAEPKAVTGADRAHFSGHMHSYACALMGMLWYADAARDARLLEFVRSGYEYMRNWGIARLGLFGEMCTTGDMTQLALKLSDAGVGDYYEDVDCYLRNHLAEMQITNPELLRQVAQTLHGVPEYNDGDTRDAVNRVVGTYFSDSGSPARIPQVRMYSTICCTGNCIPALYYAWESIVHCQEGSAKVNLLLNRASPWLDVDSYMPYEGKVVIHNKTAKSLALRIPRWVDKKAVVGRINSQAAAPDWIGNYLTFGQIKPGDEITVTFPVVTATETYTLQWKHTDHWMESTNPGRSWANPKPTKYTMTFKGNTLVDIMPREGGTGYPLYQRRQERDATTAPIKVVKRFVRTGSQARPSQGMLPVSPRIHGDFNNRNME